MKGFYRPLKLTKNYLQREYCHDNGQNTMNKVAKFYDNTNIFITGATGFLGKCLTEKLLRTCEGVNSIYLLVRQQNRASAEERLHQIVKNSAFDRLRESSPDTLKKIKLIAGDASLPNLGMSSADRSSLITNVNVVFHAAASIRLDQGFRTCFKHNTLATEYILQLCKDLKNLKTFVYVSTAYSNPEKQFVEEIVYKPVYDPKMFLNDIDSIPQRKINGLVKEILKIHPNAYTATKAMAEQLVNDYSHMFPTAIVRPSIILPAWREPYPGWVHNVSNMIFISMEIGRGTMKVVSAQNDCIADLIPVDAVVNTVIAAGWHTVAERSDTLRVYNCVSGPTNPITWQQVEKLIMKYSLEYPSVHIVRYPSVNFITNKTLFNIYHITRHIIPSVLLDMYRYFTDQRPTLLKLSKKIAHVNETTSFFSMNDWDYKYSTMISLKDALKRTKDGKDFKVDLEGLDWDRYWKDLTIGIRKWILGDELTTLPKAKEKMNRLYWMKITTNVVLAGGLLGAVKMMI